MSFGAVPQDCEICGLKVCRRDTPFKKEPGYSLTTLHALWCKEGT